MDSDNQKLNGTSSDPSYGGSTYRLSYDHAANKRNKTKKLSSFKPFIAIFIAVMLLAAFAHLALMYYDDAIERLYSSETTEGDDKTSADYQSSVNIVTD